MVRAYQYTYQCKAKMTNEKKYEYCLNYAKADASLFVRKQDWYQQIPNEFYRPDTLNVNSLTEVTKGNEYEPDNFWRKANTM